MANTLAVRELHTKLELELDKGVRSDPTLDVSESPIHKTAIALGLSSLIGTVAFVGRTATDDLVQFNTGNTGYSSIWPAWAADMARLSLETGKKLWVLSNGDPFGSNITDAIVLA
jgi:hypothetical protein